MNLSAQDAALLWSDVVVMARDVDEGMIPWLERVTPVSLEQGTMMLTTRQNWTERKIMGEYRNAVERLLQEITLEPIAIDVRIEGSAETAAQESTTAAEPPATRADVDAPTYTSGMSPAMLAGLQVKARTMGVATTPETIPTAEEEHKDDQPAENAVEHDDATPALHGDFTFDTYVVGEANEIAYKMARAVAEQPGSVANPLFIHGPSGYGKTHLLLSIVNYIETHTRGAYRTLYVDANTFVEQYVSEIHVHHTRGEDVMRRYREADVLLVDDVQMFANKQDTMSMFFDLFNRLIMQGKQIVCAADRAPDYLELDPRMRTRFGQGLVVDIKAPTYEMKWAILRSFYERSPLRAITNVDIPDDVFGILAQIGPDNPRVMQGLVTSLIPEAERDPGILTRDGLAAFVGKMHKATQVVDIALIARTVCDHFGVSLEALQSKARTKAISEARQVVMWMTRQLTNSTYEEIGTYLGNRDHATVSYGIATVEKRCADKGYSTMLSQIKKTITE